MHRPTLDEAYDAGYDGPSPAHERWKARNNMLDSRDPDYFDPQLHADPDEEPYDAPTSEEEEEEEPYNAPTSEEEEEE